MTVKKRVIEKGGDAGLFSIIGYRYLPYWPLFALLTASLFILAYLYTRYITPVYNITATLVINDEQKGVQESETLRSLNIYAANTIVENEVEVLKSRTLMQDVVNSLHLYAPVYEKGRVRPSPAYLSSPIIVQAQEPSRIKEKKKIEFEYNEQQQQVKIDKRYYSLNQWITFPYGIIRFSKNPHRKNFSVRELYFTLEDPRAVAANLGRNLEVGAGSKLSSVVNIQYKDEVPERGEDVVNHLLEAYNRTSINNNSQLAANTLSFLTERIKNVEGELDTIEQRIQQYKSRQGIVDLSQQGKIYLESVAENDRKAADINTQLAVLNQVEQYVQSGNNRTGIVPTTLGITDPVLAELLQKLNELELQYTNMRTRIGENNPMVQSVRNEIGKIRPNILGIVRNQRAQMQASLNNYNKSSGQVTSMLKTIPQKERQLLDISRQQAIKNDVYAFLLQRREDAELSTASTIADSRVIDRAQASVKPAGSKRILILLGAIMAALALGIAYVFYREGITNKVLFRSAITRVTAIPLIGEIVYRKKRQHMAASHVEDPVISAQFHQLQAALGLYDNMQKKKRILVSSSIANEGKTFISTHLAASLAAAEQKVVLVDLNLHQPESTTFYGLNNENGISDYVKGSIDLAHIIRTTSIPYLSVVPAGAKTNNATAILLNEKLNLLFKQLEKEFDFIVIDAPAIELTTDAYILSKHTDATLFIIRHGYTPVTLVQKLNENIKLQYMQGLAIVFNGIKPRGFLRKYYGYGFGYGNDNVFEKKAYRSAG